MTNTFREQFAEIIWNKWWEQICEKHPEITKSDFKVVMVDED